MDATTAKPVKLTIDNFSPNPAVDVSVKIDAPGEVFELHEDTPLRVKVGAKAPGPTSRGVWVRVSPLGEEQSAKLASKAGRSTGRQLRLVEVGMRNDGPGDLLSAGEEWAPSAMVTLPAGVEAVKVSDRCMPIVDGIPDWEHHGTANGLVYLCWPTHSPNAGESFLFPFRVEIIDRAAAAGSIVVDGGVQDPDTANNTAEITLGAGGGGGLPVTGARAGLVAGVGALLVAAGAVAVVLLRRRRIVTVVD